MKNYEKVEVGEGLRRYRIPGGFLYDLLGRGTVFVPIDAVENDDSFEPEETQEKSK